MTKVLYSTSAKARGGRTGTVETTDNTLELTLSTPKELGGEGGIGVNPEQLFACGYAACFLGAIKLVAARSEIAISDLTTVTSSVGVGPRDDGAGFGLTLSIRALMPGLEKDVARDLLEKAHVVCPYSDLSRGHVKVDVSLG